MTYEEYKTQKALGSITPKCRFTLAKDPETDPRILIDIEKIDRTVSVRWALADNPSAPKQILTKMAKDGEWLVAIKIGANPSTPKATLQYLLKSRNLETIACSVASNPSTHPSILTSLAKYENERVQELVALHRQTPTSIIKTLCNSTYKKVRFIAEKKLEERKE